MGDAFSRTDTLRVGDEIGRGAYGMVYRGTLGKRPVAIKTMHRHLLDYAMERRGELDGILERFRDECELLEAAKHANVVEFIGVFDQDGNTLLVMELMHQRLDKFLENNRGTLPLSKQLHICVNIARGLDFLHHHDPQILHRDLNPKNVMTNEEGDVVKIIDLGQSKFRPSSVMYLTTKAPGCIMYMSPECLTDQPYFTDKGDVFSLGVVALEVSTQEHTSVGFSGIGTQKELQRRAADLAKLPDDHSMKPLILQCLRDDPAERPSCREVVRKLQTMITLSNPNHPLVAEEAGDAMQQGILIEFTERDCTLLYHKAITENPTINLHVAKAMTIGPPRVGKTSLRHVLLELEPPKVSVSTPLMKTAETVSIMPSVQSDMVHLGATKSAKIPWVLVNEASGMQSLLRFLQQQVEVAATRKEAAQELDGSVMLGAAPSPKSEELMDADVHDVVIAPLCEIHPQSESVIESSSIDVDICQEEDLSSPSDVAATAGRIHQLLQSSDIADFELSDCKLLQFLDCGGQLAYHDILPVFTTIPAVYLHVFNLNEDLKSHPVDQICFNQDGGEVYAPTRSPLSVAQMMSRSVITVQSLMDKNVQLPKEILQSEPPEPHVALVGTHLDKLVEKYKGKVQRELRSINTSLKVALDSPSLDQKQMLLKNDQDPAFPMFFPIGRCFPAQGKKDESSQITRHSISKLKQKIEKLVSAVKVKVPIKWYLHQMLEVYRSTEDHKPVHLYRDLYQSCLCEQTVGDLGEFHVMVTYFHALGLLIHLCEEDVPHNEESACLVFTDPSYLFENITKLYQAQFMEEDYCEGSLLPLRCQGRLTKKALRALNVDNTYLSDDDYMSLLVQLFIGADITEKEHDEGSGGRVLFVPSVIPVSDHTVITKPSCPYFIFTFKGKFFIPCGVFTGAIARLQSQPHWKLLYKSVSRLHAKFSIGARDTVYITDGTSHIQVAVDVCAQHNAERCRDVVIKAVAQSYCFLFHGKTKKTPQCGMCQEKPFLILGLLCHCTTCEGKGATAIKLSELCTEGGAPQTVRCLESGTPQELSSHQSLLFWNIKHYAVVTKQHTKPYATDYGEDVAEDREPKRPSKSASLPSVSCILKKHEDDFFASVNAKYNLLRLKRKEVISLDVVSAIKAASNDEEAKEMLYDHLLNHGTVATLREWCEWAMTAQGHPNMQDLGKRIKDELQ